MFSIKPETQPQTTNSKSLDTHRKFLQSLVMSTPGEQKHILSELLYPAVKRFYPKMAKQILHVMTFTFHHSELLHMLNCRHFFNARMEEALIVIDIFKNFSDSDDVSQQLLMERQPLNSLLKVKLLSILQHNCSDAADIITDKLTYLENSAILHLLQCTDCLRIRIDEIRSQIFVNSMEQLLTVKSSLDNVDEPIESAAERHLLGEDLFSTLEGVETLTDEGIAEEKSPPIITQGQGRRILNEIRNVPLTSNEHKNILIKQLLPLIKSLYPHFYLEFLNAIADIDNSELIHMLWCRAFLYFKLDEFLRKTKIFGESIFPIGESNELYFSEEETYFH